MADDLGKMLSKWREYGGLSQEALGDRLDPPMAASQYRGYEGGKSSPTVRQLSRLVAALGVPGDTDATRLARFFLGPEPAPASGRLPAALSVAVDVALERVSREELADRLGLGQVEVGLLQGGVLPLSLEQFRTLCELSELSADEVLKLPVRLPLGIQKRLGEFQERAGVFAETVGSLLDEIERLRGDSN